MKSRVVRYKELWVHGISVLKKRWPFTAPSVWIWFDGNQLCAKVVTDEEIQNIDEERKDYTTTLVNDVITATLPEKSKEGFILAFQELIEKGIPKKAWHILYNCSDLRLASKRFPAMTDEELEETLYWDQDRMFTVSFDVSVAWDIISHDAMDCVVSATAVRKTVVDDLMAAAKAEMIQIKQIVPLTALIRTNHKEGFYLFCKEKSALFISRHRRGESMRIIPKETAMEIGKVFITRQREVYSIRSEDIMIFPLHDCTAESFSYWQTCISFWKSKDNNEEIMTNDENVEKIETAEDSYANIVKNFMNELPLSWWKDMERTNIDFLFHRSTDLGNEDTETHKMAWKNATVAICLLTFFYSVYGGYVYYEKEQTQEILLGKENLRQQMENEKKILKEEANRIDEWKNIEKENERWESKWVMLSEATPLGVVVREIHATDEDITINGSASNKEKAEEFMGNIERFWQMKTIMHMKGHGKGLSMMTFSITCKRQKEDA